MTVDQIMIFVLAAPFAGALLLGLFVKRHPWLRWTPALLSAGMFLANLNLYGRVMEDSLTPFPWVSLGSVGTFYLRADPLGIYFSLVICGVGFFALFYAAVFLQRNVSSPSFFVAMLTSLGSCLGVAYAGDLFTLYITFEVLAISSYQLVILDRTPFSMRAGYRYLVLSLMAGLAVLGASLLINANIGTVVFGENPLITEAASWSIGAFYLFLFGFGLKAGMFPLHIWLPDAHASAPAPASAILSGILLKCGAVGLLRILFHVYSPEAQVAGGGMTTLTVLAVASIIVGSLGALMRFELKRLLAYSSIGQMGYILMGLTIKHPMALTAAVFHMSTHAILKSCLFLSAGTLIEASGKKDTRDLEGLAAWLPVTTGAFSVAALGMIGIPPLNGFISKFYLGLGAAGANMKWGLAVLMISSFLNVLYYSPIVVSLLWKKREQPLSIPKERLQLTGLAVGFLALACIIFGLGPLNAPFVAAQKACLWLMGGY